MDREECGQCRTGSEFRYGEVCDELEECPLEPPASSQVPHTMTICLMTFTNVLVQKEVYSLIHSISQLFNDHLFHFPH